MSVTITGNVIYLEGTVGADISAADVRTSINHISSDTAIDVRLNSGGGSCAEGWAIYNVLASQPVNITVEGLAASAASLIAMAGQTITMAKGSLLMIHSPWIGSFDGNASAMRKQVKLLDKIAEDYIATYAQRSGMTKKKVSTLMHDETWFSADEAVAAGFADRVDGSAKPLARLVASCKQIPPNLKIETKEVPTMSTEKAIAEAVAADRKRRAEIVGSDDAQSKTKLAEYLANETDLPAPQAIAALAASPADVAADTNPASLANRHTQPDSLAMAGITSTPNDTTDKPPVNARGWSDFLDGGAK